MQCDELSDRSLQLTSPEWVDSLSLEDSGAAVHHTVVGPVQPALLDHLVLVLDQQLDSLDGGSDSLGDTSGNTGQHEVLEEPKLLVTHLVFLICNMGSICIIRPNRKYKDSKESL